MASDDSTIGLSGEAVTRLALVVWAGDEPRVHPLPPGRAIVLGRGAPADLIVEAPAPGEDLKVPHLGGYEHFRPTSRRRAGPEGELPVYEWWERTEIAE